MPLNVDISLWLTTIQGKLISAHIMQELKDYVGDVTGLTNRQIFQKIQEGIALYGYAGVDVNYVYQSIIGLHIQPMTLQNEAFVLREFIRIYDVIGDIMNRIPYIYILWKVVQKHALNIVVHNNYSKEKCEMFDAMLGESI